ncbi:MAG: hypothetical protein QOF55_2204 [Thermoleophilaceae bacterium]|nr:hypothetical protein [Thermoleophilaceae bacterium]
MLALACVGVVPFVMASSASADVGQARTGNPTQYDRNASVVTDAAGTTYLYFARSELACNRLATPVPNPACPDQLGYDMYVKKSLDGGQDFGPAVRVAQNPFGAGPAFRGRTIAATVTPDGVHVFWADGGNNNAVYHAFKPNGQDTFDAQPQPMGDIPADVFNVEAVSVGDQVYVYTQEFPDIKARQYTAAGNALTPDGGPTFVDMGGRKSIPKAIVDVRGGCKMTMADDSNYPQVNVYTDASPDCLNWPAPARLVVDQPGSNWDPNLIQKPNGEYYLHFAPDHTAAGLQQQIALTKSNDFVNWTAPHDLTPGQQGGTPYWDYWPEGFVRNNQIVLFYTSERRINQDSVTAPAGVGHIWTDPGFGGLDHLGLMDR